jgi:leucine dehydrogenase
MTYKSALARLSLGGGKSVVRTDLKTIDREQLFEAIGECIEHLGGSFIIAEDVNSTVEDMAVVRRKTHHVATVGASGNPSPFTAYGVYCALKASVHYKYGRDDLHGLTVAIQGAGETGGRLAELLYKEKCRLIIADINERNIDRLNKRIDFEHAAPEAIYDVDCDIFSPCALGGIINSSTIPLLRCSIVVGSANNQLQSDADGYELFRRGVLYVPDYAANAGGIINISCEMGQPYDKNKSLHLTEKIGQTVLELLHRSKQTHRPTNEIADALAEMRIGTTIMAS